MNIFIFPIYPIVKYMYMYNTKCNKITSSNVFSSPF